MLTIKPDADNICWTHFASAIGAVRVLQELPKPLRRMVSGFVGVLIDCGITVAELRMDGLRIQNGSAVTRLQPFRTRLTHETREGLSLVAWWLDYTHRREVILSRHRAGAGSEYATWRCPDCAMPVKAERAYCANSLCPSWDKLFRCTGDPLLHVVPRVA